MPYDHQDAKPQGFQSSFSEQTPEFWLSFLKTPEAKNNKFMQQLAQELSTRPWLIAKPGFQQEKGHFCSWFADTFLPWPRSNTEQGNALADLTIYHEWMHMITLPRGYNDPLDWMGAIRSNESQVSIETEMLVRSRIPGLQEKAFPNQAVWAERLSLGKDQLFLDRPQDKERMERCLILLDQPGREKDLYDRSEGRFIMSSSQDETFWGFTHRELWALRRGVGLWPNHQDPIEAQMHLYEALSDAWLLKWVGPAQEIEHHRLDLQTRSAQGDGEAAIADFSDWLDLKRGPHGIPFEHLALDAEEAKPLLNSAPTMAVKRPKP